MRSSPGSLHVLKYTTDRALCDAGLCKLLSHLQSHGSRRSFARLQGGASTRKRTSDLRVNECTPLGRLTDSPNGEVSMRSFGGEHADERDLIETFVERSRWHCRAARGGRNQRDHEAVGSSSQLVLTASRRTVIMPAELPTLQRSSMPRQRLSSTGGYGILD